MVLGTRCNYESTLEGLILSHHFGRWLQTKGNKHALGTVFADLWTAHEVLVNAADDGMVTAMTMISLKSHMDLFNVGILLGKAAKFATQLYLSGMIYTDH